MLNIPATTNYLYRSKHSPSLPARRRLAETLLYKVNKESLTILYYYYPANTPAVPFSRLRNGPALPFATVPSSCSLFLRTKPHAAYKEYTDPLLIKTPSTRFRRNAFHMRSQRRLRPQPSEGPWSTKLP